jgi:DNA-binding MarR family transcriptional regulator
MARNKPHNVSEVREVREPGRFAYEGLDRLIHEKARLSILSSLASHADGLVFSDLKALCALTDGNLSRQITQLQEAGLVEVWKGHKGNRPQTLVRLSSQGQKRFLEYLEVLEGVLDDASSTARRSSAAQPNGLLAR